jgi:hypothetical protein
VTSFGSDKGNVNIVNVSIVPIHIGQCLVRKMQHDWSERDPDHDQDNNNNQEDFNGLSELHVFHSKGDDEAGVKTMP